MTSGVAPASADFSRARSGIFGAHRIAQDDGRRLAEVDDIIVARDRLQAAGARVLGTGEPKIGAHGKPVLFLHPKDFTGTLVELEQV